MNVAAPVLDDKPPALTAGQRVRDIFRRPAIGPALALVIALIVFGIINPGYFAPYNISLILQQSMVVGVLAIAQTIIILTAGIDLSIGALSVLGTVVAVKLTLSHGLAVGFLVALATCVVIGLVNGWLVARINLPPFIVTLGTFTALTALAKLVAGSVTYNAPKGPLTFLGDYVKLGTILVPYGVFLLIIAYAVAWYALTQTKWGRNIYSVGGNIEAARRTGLRVNRVLIGAYVTAGCIAVLGAWIALGRIPTADPNAYQTANLDSITAVVIGGTSLFGGRGGVVGTLLGVLIVGVLRNGLTLAGVDSLYQDVATGVLVIVAVAIDQLARRKAQ
ncbi:ABC transporter permease [Micrococcales bacterium 31B]|nr:ABC transporter permease [Micrococcales bacterium 31B]